MTDRLVRHRLWVMLVVLALLGCQRDPDDLPAKPPAGPTVAPIATQPRPLAAPTAAPGQPTRAPSASKPTVAAQPAPSGPPDLGALRLAHEKLAGDLVEPLQVTHAGDGSNRLFVVEKGGRIRIIKGDKTQPEPFLDIRERVGSSKSEQGLLGLAFHPKYASTGRLYVNYTDLNGDTVVARFQVTAQDPDRADPTSGRTVLAFKQPYANHNGGNLVFGPDGYLWIGTGDGGSGGDPQGNGQSKQTVLGKMLRIDVDGGDPYAIPPDNPFVNDPKARPEIWAIGLRNPWRYSFDRATGDLYIADVGQNRYEEVNVTPAGSKGGHNYGWSIMEGRHCFNPGAGCDQTGLEQPVAEYGREGGCSVTGGHVYRGQRFPALRGVYFYADFCSGRIWGLLRPENGQWQSREVLFSGLQISSFGEDEAGEVYVVAMATGAIHRLTQRPA